MAAALAAIVLLGAFATSAVLAADGAVVRAVLFFSPTCPHCHQVMTQDLPPIQATYGDAFQLLEIDVTGSAGSDVYAAAVGQLAIPESRIGVPTLIVGDTVLVGSVEIPQLLPMVIEGYIRDGGADWPAIPGLAAFVPTPPSEPGSTAPAAGTPTSTPASTPAAFSPAPSAAGAGSTGGGTRGDGLGMLDRAGRDPTGSGLAVGVLVALVLALTWAVVALVRSGLRRTAGARSPVIPVLAVLGLTVAAYLSSVELSGSSAVCGPVGDCNAVHASSYARLFGIPVGVLGVAGYVGILGLWLAVRFGGRDLADSAAMGVVVMASIGTAFSAYLTFLEPFVIGATCAWCLASAVLMGSILIVSVGPGREPLTAT